MLKNKTVLITGGMGRIGLTLAKKVVDNGGRVIIVDKDKKVKSYFKNKIDSDKYLAIKADTCDVKQLKSCIKLSIKHFGGFDVAVHAAYPRSNSWGTKFENLKKKFLYEDLSHQLGGAILFSQKVLDYFKSQGHGNLIHISSIQGVCSPKFEHYHGTAMVSPIEYSAIKSGIIAITKYLSKYYKNNNIRVNVISPGGILDAQPKTFLKKYRSSCNDKGMLNMEDLIGTMVFLISEESRYINGQNIIVDDGWTL